MPIMRSVHLISVQSWTYLLHPGVLMGTGEFTAGDNPAMD